MPKAAILALPVAALVFASSVVFARAIVEATWEEVMTNRMDAAEYARVRSYRDYLPQIVRAPNSAIVFGVCYAEKGFIPEEFDDQLARAHGRSLTTFAFTTASMHATTLKFLADTIADAYRDAGTRPDLVLVELNQIWVAPEANEASNGVPVGYNRTMRSLLVRDFGSLARVLVASPSAGAEAAGTWALGGTTRGYTSEWMCNHSLDHNLQCRINAPAWWPWPDDSDDAVYWREMRRDWDRFVPALRRENGPRALSWSMARRGYVHRMPSTMVAEFEAYTERLATRFDAAYVGDYNRYDREVLELSTVDDAPFARYLAAIRALQALGVRVIAFASPKASYLIAKPSYYKLYQDFYQASARKLAALDVPVVQFNSQRYALTDFHNTWGLLSEDTAAPRFSRDLADAAAAILAGEDVPWPVARIVPATGASSDVGGDPFWPSEVATSE